MWTILIDFIWNVLWILVIISMKSVVLFTCMLTVMQLLCDCERVIRVKALSHLGFPITYELTTDSGAQSNDFAVDQRTGAVDLLHTLDYETDPVEYHLKIKALENRRVPATSTVNVNSFFIYEQQNITLWRTLWTTNGLIDDASFVIIECSVEYCILHWRKRDGFDIVVFWWLAVLNSIDIGTAIERSIKLSHK